MSISLAAGISGIFVLPGLVAAMAGPWVGLSFILAGIFTLPAVASTEGLLLEALRVADQHLDDYLKDSENTDPKDQPGLL